MAQPARAIRRTLNPKLANAAMRGDTERIAKCLDRGVYVNGQDVKGRSAMHLAAEFGHPEAFKLLCNRGGTLLGDNDSNMPLHVAARFNNASITSFVISRFPEAIEAENCQAERPLHHATGNTVKVLLDAGADYGFKNKAGETALHIATKRQDEDTVNTLVEAGAAADARDNSGLTPIHLAVKERSFAILRTLSDKFDKAKLARLTDKSNRSPLHYVRSLHEAVQLLANKNDPCLNALDNLGQSPLHIASKNATPAVVEVLIAWGASLKTKNKQQRTPAEDLCYDQDFWMPTTNDSEPLLEERLCILDSLLSDWWKPSPRCKQGLDTWTKRWLASRDKRRVQTIKDIEEIIARKAISRSRNKRLTMAVVGVPIACAMLPTGVAAVGAVGVAGYYAVTCAGKAIKTMSPVQYWGFAYAMRRFAR